MFRRTFLAALLVASTLSIPAAAQAASSDRDLVPSAAVAADRDLFQPAAASDRDLIQPAAVASDRDLVQPAAVAGDRDLVQLTAAEMAAAVPAPSRLVAYNPRTEPRARQVKEDQLGDAPSCYTGYVCQKVRMESACDLCFYREFLFYDYGTYKVFDWTGTGPFRNKQTDNATYRFLNAAGTQIRCVYPGSAVQDLWPVEYVVLSPGRC